MTKPKYTTIEKLEAAFKEALDKLSPEERNILLHHVNTLEVSNEELEKFRKEHPHFTEQLMKLYRKDN